jgi:hypothetical protein
LSIDNEILKEIKKIKQDGGKNSNSGQDCKAQ